MVKLYAVSIYYKADKPKLLKAAHDLQSFGYFQRSSVKEFMDFTGSIIVERTGKGQRASVKEQDYMCHVFVRNDSLAAVAVCDAIYPSRVAFMMLNKLLDEHDQVVGSSFATADPNSYTFTACDDLLLKYQNPNEADPMTKVQHELDETKVIVFNTLEQVMQRGEKLDDLVAKSEGLSTSSKTFYKTAKKTNSCCGW